MLTLTHRSSALVPHVPSRGTSALHSFMLNTDVSKKLTRQLLAGEHSAAGTAVGGTWSVSSVAALWEMGTTDAGIQAGNCGLAVRRDNGGGKAAVDTVGSMNQDAAM